MNLKKYCKDCLKDNLKNKVQIFNRWGTKVYEKENYMLDKERFTGDSESKWDYMGEEKLPTGTYFYILEIRKSKNSEVVRKSGYIYLQK